MPQEKGTPIVIDNGSGMCKAGFSGYDAPATSFPAVVGTPKYEQWMHGFNPKQIYVGQEAIAKKGVLKIHYPIEHGIVQNWQYMEQIWEHCFYNQLRATPTQHPVLLTEAPRNPKVNRQKMTEIMFQTFNVPAYYLSIQAVLSLYSSGKTTGLVIDAGDGVTHTVPIYEGYALSHAIERNNLAGRDLTEFMRKLLNQIGLDYNSSSEKEIVRDVKEKCCYVALDYKAELQKYKNSEANNKIFELPDGHNISIGDQRFRCPQALFNPMLIGKQIPSLHEMAYQSVQKCDIDVRKELYGNIVISGGTTMFEGISDRLNKQLSNMVSPNMRIKIAALAERKYLVWLGGSILTELSSFQTRWITKAEYQETGSSIVHRKCF